MGMNVLTDNGYQFTVATDGEEANGMALEALSPGFAPRDVRPTRDAMSLQAGVQRRARRLPGEWSIHRPANGYGIVDCAA